MKQQSSSSSFVAAVAAVLFIVLGVTASICTADEAIINTNADADHPKFPSDLIQRCHFGDGECIRNLTQHLFAEHQHGIAELALPALSPMDIGTVTVNQGDGSGPVSVHITMSRVKLYGWDKLQVQRVRGFGKDPRQSKFQIDVFAPVEHMVGRYKLTGKMLLLPVTGHGAANLTIEGVQMNVTLRTTVAERGGAEYLQIDGGRVQVGIGRLRMQFENLLGDAELSRGVNAMLNEQQHLLIGEIRGAVSKSFEEPLRQIIGPMFARYPYGEMFLPDEATEQKDG